jgi:uracil-DNA glycosylase
MFDLSELGAWADLRFFSEDLPAIEAALEQDPRTIFPPREKVFAALEACAPDDVRVIILGQDPYHTPGKADGLAFSIPDGFGGRLDSLGNMLTELENDLGTARARTDLADWAAEGVLLLNTALTVPKGAAKAHAKLGWDKLVREVLTRLNDAPRAALLWGRPAQSFAKHLNNPDHLILTAPHPSPLSVHRGFFGSRPFSTVNQWLKQRQMSEINWVGASG